MANPGDEQKLPGGNDDSPTLRELDHFITLLPELCYSVNRMLEDCTPEFSKKVGVALWALGRSTKADDVGKYLTTSDLVSTFRDWFVVSEASASPEVSKVKSDLFGRQFIKIEGDRDHIHLTERGQEAVRAMYERARTVVRQTVSTLMPGERAVLLDFAQRMIATKRKPVTREVQSGREASDNTGKLDVTG